MKLKITVLTLFVLVSLTILLLSLKNNQDTRNRAADIPSSQISSVEIGSILTHGQTYSDRWGSEGNHPPVDGSINSWSFYPNGQQIVTKGNQYWLKPTGNTSWTGPSNLKSKWAACTNFPASGIDAYSIDPATSSEYAFSGYNLYVLTSTGACSQNGTDWRSQWAAANSPGGQTPFSAASKITQFQWLSPTLQAYITGDKLWFIGTAASLSTACHTTPIPADWHFCNPETLTQRWSSFENHPSVSSIPIFAVSQNPYFQLYASGPSIWSIGENNIWDVFRSGYDGYGAREPTILNDSGTYYLYYDAADAYQPWQTAVATSTHPVGPWTKRGLVTFTGAKRAWESECSCASTVFKIGSTYYNFYMGGRGIYGNSLYRVPSPGTDVYYSLGLAVSSSPFGPFRRIRGDGTLNDSTASDPSLVPVNGFSWHPNSPGSADGSLLLVNGTYYYTYSSGENNSFGVGIIQSNSPLGPWTEVAHPLIPYSMSSENSGVYFDQSRNTYFLLSNAIYLSGNVWSSYDRQCPTAEWHGVGAVLYWSSDLLTWTPTVNQKMIATAQPGFGCSGSPFIDPSSTPRHRGTVGMGSLTTDASGNLYALYDGGDFLDSADLNKNHMFRNIFASQIVLPPVSATNTPVPTPTSATPTSTTATPTSSIPTTVPTSTPTRIPNLSPVSEPTCDACGWCPPHNKPSTWIECSACLYNTDGSEKKGSYYTVLGCFQTDQSGAPFMQSVLQIVFGIAGGIAFVSVLVGIVIIITSSGIPSRIQLGKDIITSSIVGLLLILFSVFILKIIGVDILKIPGVS